MTSRLINFVLDFHNKLIVRRGIGNATDFSEKGQLTRFKTVLSYIAKDGEPATILDCGCGVGDFYPLMRHHNAQLAYTGIDVNPAFVQELNRRYGEKAFVGNASKSCTKLRHYDYVVLSGVLNYAQTDARKLLACLWPHCTRRLIANFLAQTPHNRSLRHLQTYSIEDILAIAHSLHDRFILDHAYLDNDTTLILCRQ